MLAGRDLFKQRGPACLALDAARLGGENTLLISAFSPVRSAGVWLPPQVLLGLTPTDLRNRFAVVAVWLKFVFQPVEVPISTCRIVYFNRLKLVSNGFENLCRCRFRRKHSKIHKISTDRNLDFGSNLHWSIFVFASVLIYRSPQIYTSVFW